MKRSKYFGTVFIIVLAIILTATMVFPGCTSTQPSTKVYNLTFAMVDPLDSPNGRVISAWGKWLGRESKGRIKLTVLPSEQAAKVPDLYDAVANHLTDMGHSLAVFSQGMLPLNDVTTLPYIFGFPSGIQGLRTHIDLFNKYPELQAEIKGNVKLLFFTYGNPIQLCTVSKPIRALEDFKGQILVESGSIPSKGLQILGGTPEAGAQTEMFDAMQKGVVTGIEGNYSTLKVFGFGDLVNYITESSGYQSTYFMNTMNLDTWNSLPRDLQGLFSDKNLQLVGELTGYEMDNDDLGAKKLMAEKFQKAGLPEIYVLPASEKAKWLNLLKPLEEDWIKQATSLVGESKARAILADCRKFAEGYVNAYQDNAKKYEDTLKEWNAISP